MKIINLLDLCCKAGGAAMGYKQAADDLGIEINITGIDIEAQPNYPFNFIQDDAVKYFKKNYKKYTHYHASPPCQKFSVSTNRFRTNGKIYPDNLKAIKDMFYKINKPCIIENVMPAPIRADIVLRGDMFNLKLLKKRKFETINWFCFKPCIPIKIGSVKAGDFAQVLGKGQLKVTNGQRFKVEGNNVKEVWSNAMDINWMTLNELAEAIPPAYTRWIGNEFFKL